jgi:hypothetical protein
MMIKVNGETIEFELAANMLNYDKAGHETGLGSRGIILKINDGVGTELLIYIGLKFDVISILTNRFMSTFVNIPRDIKGKMQHSSKSSEIGPLETSADFDNENAYMDVYVDIHKLTINIPKLAHLIYENTTAIDEYVAIARFEAFKTRMVRTSRAISATMQRVYDGNLENFGFIFTRNEKFSVLNEMIVDDNIIHDEIKYTYWLTPHDPEDYKFIRDGHIPLESGSEVVSGFGDEIEAGNNTIPLFSYDRRVARFGYYDVTVKDPVVNFGYNDGTTEVHDTFMFTRDGSGRIHKTSARQSINFSFRTKIGEVFSSMLSGKTPSRVKGALKKSIIDGVKEAIYSIAVEKRSTAHTEAIDSIVENSVIPTILKAAEAFMSVDEDYAKNVLLNAHKKTTVVPLAMMNILHKDDLFSRDYIEDSIILMYHPILDKFVMYDIGVNDSIEILPRKIQFVSNGTRYGIDFSGSEYRFLWSNIEKRSRTTNSKWYNMLGNQIGNGLKPEELDDRVMNLFNMEESDIFRFDDLCVNGKCAKILVVKKSDFLSNLKKTTGEYNSEFLLGIKTGDVNLVEGSVWM